MLMMDLAAGPPVAAAALPGAASASVLSIWPSERPRLLTTPTRRKSRRVGRHGWSLPLHPVGFQLLIARAFQHLIVAEFARYHRRFGRTDAISFQTFLLSAGQLRGT